METLPRSGLLAACFLFPCRLRAALFSQSSLSSAGLERANWPRGKLGRVCSVFLALDAHVQLFSTEVAGEIVVRQDNQNFAATVDAVCHVLDNGLSQLKISCVNAVGYWVFIENGNQIFIDPRTIFWTVTDEKIVALHNSFFKVTRSMWWIGALFLYKEMRSYRNRHKDDCWWNNDDRQDPTPATGRRGILGGYKPCGRSWNVIWSSYGVPVAVNSGNLISVD